MIAPLRGRLGEGAIPWRGGSGGRDSEPAVGPLDRCVGLASLGLLLLNLGKQGLREARRAACLGLWVGIILSRQAAAGTIPQPWTDLLATLPEAQQALVEWRWEEALSLFQRAAEGQEPGKARLGRLGVGLCWQALGQPEKALLLWEGLTGEADIAAAQAHYLLAQAALERGEMEVIRKRHEGTLSDWDMAVIDFDLGEQRWWYEVQMLRWAGGCSWFDMDPHRGARQVADLYLVVACDGQHTLN